MKKTIVAAAFFFSQLAFATPVCVYQGHRVGENPDRIANLTAQHVAGKTQALISGTVVKLLPDDQTGLPHQKFLINSNGINIMAVYNLDLGARVPARLGEAVTVCGEYLPHIRMIHWTHYDPDHRHADGFIYYQGTAYGARP